MRIEGQIIVCFNQAILLLRSQATEQGFDEFMNVVLDQAAEVYLNDRKPRKEIGEPFFLTPLTTL